MAKTTTSNLFVKPLQYFEEAVEGTFQDDVGNNYLGVGAVNSFAIKIDNSYREVSQIGPEDLIAILRGRKVTESRITYRFTDSLGKAFFKYLVNAANAGTPAGTISKSLSMATSLRIDGTEYYLKMLGSRAKTVTLSCGVERDWEVSVDMFHTDILEPTTTAPVNAVLTSTFASGSTWDWLSGGANPATHGANVLPMQETSITWNRNTNGDWVMGNRIAHSSQSHGRRIAGTAKLLFMPYTGSSLVSGLMEADTAANFAVVVKSGMGGMTVTLTGAKFTNLDRSDESEQTQATAEDYGIMCTGFTDVS